MHIYIWDGMRIQQIQAKLECREATCAQYWLYVALILVSQRKITRSLRRFYIDFTAQLTLYWFCTTFTHNRNHTPGGYYMSIASLTRTSNNSLVLRAGQAWFFPRKWLCEKKKKKLTVNKLIHRSGALSDSGERLINRGTIIGPRFWRARARAQAINFS